jgi:hypothetical protein
MRGCDKVVEVFDFRRSVFSQRHVSQYQPRGAEVSEEECLVCILIYNRFAESAAVANLVKCRLRLSVPRCYSPTIHGPSSNDMSISAVHNIRLPHKSLLYQILCIFDISPAVISPLLI